MKRILFSSIFILIFCSSYAQKQSLEYSNIITTKKLVVRNKKNPTDNPSIYLIPIVSKKYPKLRDALSDTNLFHGAKLDSVIREYQTTGWGYASFSYEVTFVSKDVISIKLYYETMGAHPDESQQWLTFDIRTGKHYSLNNEIDPRGLKWVYTTYKTTLRKRILENKEGKDCGDTYNDLKIAVDNLKINELFKGYVFTKEGLMISMEKILPHVVQACEPNRELMIPYSKLKSFKTSTAIVIK
jgi:hypothetical protein